MIQGKRALAARIGPLLVVSAWLGGCATLTLPVTMSMQNTPEHFVGSATGHLDGAGEIEVTSDSGAKCVGRFVYVNGRQGRGTLACGDGRSGAFDFVSTGSRGTGQGQIMGQPFTLLFGK